MMSAVFDYIAAHRDECLSLLMRACSQPSVSALHEGLDEMAALVTDLLRETGFEVEPVPTDGAPVVMGRMAGESDRTLLLYNHYDVQPVDPLDEWTTPPFEPTIRDGKVYARGTADNKGAIISRLCAFRAYLAHHDRLPVNIVWVIEGEEEIGSPYLGQFVERYADLLRGVYGCVWEAGGKDSRERYNIALGCKGLLYVELHAREANRDLHSSNAAIVDNPAWRLVWALNTLKGPDGRVLIPGFYDDVRPPTPAQREALARWDYPEEETRLLYGIDRFLGGATGERLKEQLIFSPTCNIDGFHSGYGGPGSKTVLPAEATVKLDFRLVPEQEPERILGLLREHLAAQGFDDVEIISYEGEPPSAGDPAHPFVQTAAQVAEGIYGHYPALIPMMSGTGPVQVLCGQFGVPVVTAGVGYAGSRGHAPNENIRLDDFFAGTRYIAALLDALRP